MGQKFTIGDKVKISKKYHWAQLATGIIENPPEEVKKLSGDWKNHMRIVKTLKDDKEFYWVAFNIPQVDGDGDGPYAEAAIDGDFLLKI